MTSAQSFELASSRVHSVVWPRAMASQSAMAQSGSFMTSRSTETVLMCKRLAAPADSWLERCRHFTRYIPSPTRLMASTTRQPWVGGY